MNYIVIEMQTNGGVTSTLTNQYTSINVAEQKYYQVLSAAAVSSVEVHGALLLDQYCGVIKKDKFIHSPEPEPDAE